MTLDSMIARRDAALASYRSALAVIDRAEFKGHVVTVDMIKAVNAALSEYEWHKTLVMREEARIKVENER